MSAILKSDNDGRTPLSVLFIEDSEVDVELAVLELQRDGFDVKWERVDVEPEMRRALETPNGPQIILSDYSMPAFDGLSALRVARELRPDLPFIFISGTIGEERAISSIHSGATDYILKGNIRRLATAVRRALSDSEERAAAKVAEEERARLAAILETTIDFVAICDSQRRLIYANAACRALLTGADHGRPLPETIDALHPAWARDSLYRTGLPMALKNGSWQGESAVLSVDGTEIPVSQVIIAHRGADGKIDYVSAIARDMRERKAYEERIRYLANFDALTGLPNRTLLGDRVAQAIAHRRHSDRVLALLTVDIDRFKLVNDGYGQAAGDQLLKLVGERLQGIIREGDTAARLGADGYAILAADLAHAGDVLAVVRKIQGGIRGAFNLNGREVHVTVSVGAAIYPRDGEDFETLLRNADAAMHRVKADGQDGFQFYAADMTRDAAERVELESALRGALTQHQLELHYQPQMRVAAGEVIGVEALMRWKHPERGWIPPGTFIPIAEHSDLIYGLGDWALATACRQLREWGVDAGSIRLAVNVSARQFRSSGFTEAVGRVLRFSGLDPARLELELTESVLVQDQDEGVEILKRLKDLGVQIAIDDFGTGYSSLSYLSRLPIDCLKIDRSFVSRSATDRHDAAIVQAIISLAGSLGMRVLAEGVETEEQLAFLRSLGCEEAQGFLFSKPLPQDAAASFISDRIVPKR
jgi:diguanylate cyclase (GGDEF)-like protein/PAS domain S-box-containing protein